jgi:hypothetical protein
MPTVYNVNKGTPPLSTGAGGTPLSPGLNNVMPATSGLYSFSPVSTPTSTSASISSSASSPQSGFQPGNDFGTSNNGAGGGVFDMQGMDMEFGGYGVPMADKEAMLRHFAPAMSQDGQIGVDRDTMMMWTAMPATLECVSIYGSFWGVMKLILALLLIKGRKIGKCTCRACWVLVPLTALVLMVALAWTLVLMGWEGFYDPDSSDRRCTDRPIWLVWFHRRWMGCIDVQYCICACYLVRALSNLSI